MHYTHLVEKACHTRCSQLCRPFRHNLAHISGIYAVLVTYQTQAELVQHLPAVVELTDFITNDIK